LFTGGSTGIGLAVVRGLRHLQKKGNLIQATYSRLPLFTATLAAIFYIFPNPFPFFSPGKGFAANGTIFNG